MSVFELRLKHDRDGRIVEKTEIVAGRPVVWKYAYDKAGRLFEAHLDNRLICQCYYDRDGRRQRDYFPATVGSSYRDYRYNLDNRLMSAGNNGFTHDENGFRSIWSNGGTYHLYEYALDYRLLKMEVENQNRVFTFRHDEQGRRAAKYFNGQLVEAYRWLDFIRLGAFLDGRMGHEFGYADNARLPSAMRREDGTVFTLHYDQVGSLRVVADTDGDVIKEILYDPFGGIIEDTNPGFHVPIGFAGGLHDRELGFVRFGWRDYDTFTGRWTAPDPIGDKGGDPDWYGYCLDDPVNGVDPLGLASKKYAGADSEAGLFFNIGGLQYTNDKEELDVLDEDGQTRKRFEATSGKPGVKDYTLKNKNPIPPGEYLVKLDEVSKAGWMREHLDWRDWGKYRAPMHPDGKTDTHGRSGFFLHGGKRPGSAGCVDVGSSDEELFPLLQKQRRPVKVKVK